MARSVACSAPRDSVEQVPDAPLFSGQRHGRVVPVEPDDAGGGQFREVGVEQSEAEVAPSAHFPRTLRRERFDEFVDGRRSAVEKFREQRSPLPGTA